MRNSYKIYFAANIHNYLTLISQRLQMDGSTVDHSDSDSGESWTLLENLPAYGDDAPDCTENSPTPCER